MEALRSFSIRTTYAGLFARRSDSTFTIRATEADAALWAARIRSDDPSAVLVEVTEL